MTADIVCEMAKRPQPVIWILHEWWDDKMITENLGIRNIGGLTLETVKQALIHASMIVFVCEAQRQLYKPTAPSSVIYVGVPVPLTITSESFPSSPSKTTDIPMNEIDSQKRPFTFLCLGIVCPRKNQVWAIKLFKKFAGDRQDVKLVIVGARYTRQYEIDYITEVKKAIDHDKRIELHDVTDTVEQFYRISDCLLFTSTNQVTPMVISEAMSWGLPVLSTNIAGIPEMITDGVEGFLFFAQDDTTALTAMNKIVYDEILRMKMGAHGLQRFKTRFDLDIMVESYRDLVMTVAPPIILIDMDGVLGDWDQGFYNAWNNRCEVDREKSYFMEQCVSTECKREAELLMHSAGFFESLPPMMGSIQAMNEMKSAGFKVFICTSPLMTSHYCAQEKLNWIRMYLGELWLDKVILCFDKSIVKGDILIDDKPFEFLTPGGRYTTATWKHVLFDAPYNQQMINSPRITLWNDWREVLIPLFGRSELIEEMYGKVDNTKSALTASTESEVKKNYALLDKSSTENSMETFNHHGKIGSNKYSLISPRTTSSNDPIKNGGRLCAAALRSTSSFPTFEELTLDGTQSTKRKTNNTNYSNSSYSVLNFWEGLEELFFPGSNTSTGSSGVGTSNTHHHHHSAAAVSTGAAVVHDLSSMDGFITTSLMKHHSDHDSTSHHHHDANNQNSVVVTANNTAAPTLAGGTTPTSANINTTEGFSLF